jgi:putative PIN family toxin of toxin-antitoxin system
MMKKIVIDTNIIISAAFSPKGNPAEIVRMVSDKEVQAYYCTEILDEYKKVLAYKRLNIDSRLQKETMDMIKEYFVLINSTTPSSIPLPDESDRIFYDAAKASGAILITGNKKHYPDEEFIMTPAEYLFKYFAI